MPPSFEGSIQGASERPSGTSEPAQTATIVALDGARKDALTLWLEHLLPDVKLTVVGPSALETMAPWDILRKVSFVLVESNADAAPWISPVHLKAIQGLPVAVLPTSPISASALDRARLEGLSVCLSGSPEDQGVLRDLLQAPRWFMSQMEKVAAPEIMQLLAASGHSGVLSLACPHTTPLSARAWHETPSVCRGDDTCEGAAMRVYFEAGRPIHAEAGPLEGLPAFAAALELSGGVARFLEVHLQPVNPTISGSLSEVILQATIHTDETSYHGSDSSDPLQLEADDDMSTSERPPPLPPTVSEQLRDACARARVVVHADVGGGVRDATGEDSGEGVAAVAAMMSQSFQKAVGELGLGEIQGWALVSESSACVTANLEEGLAAAAAPPPSDAFRQLNEFIDRAQTVLEGGGKHG